MPALMMLSYWKPVAIALALAGLLVYRAVLVHQRDAAVAEVATMTAQFADLKSAEAACEAAVAQQNAAASASEEERRAAAIEDAPIAPDCAGAIKWGNEQAQELGKW